MRKVVFSLFLSSAVSLFGQTQLTIYNQNFAVVRELRTMDLKKGENEVRITDITACLEPDSVILRDINKPESIQILEQNYEGDPLNATKLLRQSEGKILDFEMVNPPTGERKVIKGKVVRGGHYQLYSDYSDPQEGGPPIVEVEGKIRFGLPGKPLFPPPGPDAMLKPTLQWLLHCEKGGKRQVEFSYLTGRIRWEATYNAIAPEKGDCFDLIGWVTLQNKSGKDFESANVKLMAGDIARARPDGSERGGSGGFVSMGGGRPAVTERSFDEYHLYTLERPTTVRDREIKQVEFVRAASVPAKRIYVYDGYKKNEQDHSCNARSDSGYGTLCNPKVWVMLEFKNSEVSHLGMPLPKGKVKMYRHDTDGRNEFTGEDEIDHTPKDETVRLRSGNAFDLVGERRQASFKRSTSQDEWADESFEIKLRNHKKEDVPVRVVEHLYRWANWKITSSSIPFTQMEAQTAEFRLSVPAGEERAVQYTVHYSW